LLVMAALSGIVEHPSLLYVRFVSEIERSFFARDELTISECQPCAGWVLWGMDTVPPLKLTQCLGPAEIGVAVSAFQAALQAVDERTTGEFSPLDLRRVLARSIIEPALRGERNPNKLCKAALSHLGALAAGTPTRVR
jgi:hypothetical protein